MADYRPLIADLTLPDPDDRHVLAAAISAKASVIVTWNLKDFPARNLLAHDVTSKSPDDFLTDLHAAFQEALISSVRSAKHNLRRTTPSVEAFVDALHQGGLKKFSGVLRRNSGSSFFGQKPFRLVLPDLLDLYTYLNAYIERHRKVLLGRAPDPGMLFVKTVKTTSIDAAYNQTTFYEAWRLAIQRYGIYNPYTGRGAIKGLLPHGPHNVRDVLATHILKQTGSYEQASYAIQDTPDVVQQHYGHFLPQDKAALAARILNQVWEAA